MYTRKADSATPLPVGTYRTESRRCIACSSQKSKASSDTYSGPPSDCHVPFGGQPSDVMNACHTLYAERRVDVVRSLQKTGSRTLDQSSTKTTMYLHPFQYRAQQNGPHVSE